MKINLLTFSLLALISFTASAQNLNGRFSSSIYTFERFDTVDVSETYVRAYEMLNLNFSYDKVSIKSFFNLENDLSQDMMDDPRLRFYNLFFEARDLGKIATVRLGRQPLYNSVAGGIFDGASLSLKHFGYKLTGYYGGNVPAYQKLEVIENFGDNYILGGKFVASSVEHFQFSLSYINKNFKPQSYMASRLDPDLNPISVLIENESNQYEFASAEVSFFMENKVDANIRFDYDLNFEQASKFEFYGRYEEVEDLGLSVYYNYREPRIRYNSIFSVFDYGTTQEIEVGGDYRIDASYTIIGKIANVIYEDENSQRITIGLNSSYGTFTYRKNLGYAGELDAVSLYTAKTFLEGVLTPSIGISYTNYKLSGENESNDLTTILAGVNVRPFRTLSFDLQGQYLNNKIYKDDTRLLFKLNYWFNLNF